MIVQHYRSKLETPEAAEIGQPVYRTGTERIVGYIWKWDGKIADVILFDPQDLELKEQEFVAAWVDDATGLHQKMMQLASPSVRRWWKETLSPGFTNG